MAELRKLKTSDLIARYDASAQSTVVGVDFYREPDRSARFPPSRILDARSDDCDHPAHRRERNRVPHDSLNARIGPDRSRGPSCCSPVAVEVTTLLRSSPRAFRPSFRAPGYCCGVRRPRPRCKLAAPITAPERAFCAASVPRVDRCYVARAVTRRGLPRGRERAADPRRRPRTRDRPYGGLASKAAGGVGDRWSHVVAWSPALLGRRHCRSCAHVCVGESLSGTRTPVPWRALQPRCRHGRFVSDGPADRTPDHSDSLRVPSARPLFQRGLALPPGIQMLDPWGAPTLDRERIGAPSSCFPTTSGRRSS